MSKTNPAERVVRDIRRKTRKQYSAEEKSRIVLSGLRGEAIIGQVLTEEALNNWHDSKTQPKSTATKKYINLRDFHIPAHATSPTFGGWLLIVRSG